MKRLMLRIAAVLAAIALVTTAAGWLTQRPTAATTSLRTARVERGDLVTSIDATGTVEPEEVIDVGAQVAGKVVSFGKDFAGKPIDYGSVVDEGTTLAHIDKSLYAAELAQAEAQVRSAKASVRRAEADLEQNKAKLVQAAAGWARAQKLKPTDVLSEVAQDEYRSANDCAKANVAVAEAAIEQAKAALDQAEAAAVRERQNVDYCVITSPVKGVIIDRRVNIGQTVVSSMSAPSLFLLAKDLTRMQVWVAVNEADVGQIHEGQRVRFRVDAFPDESFEGKVRKVRLNAAMTQNVVTYTVEIQADNQSGRLLPYLTANVQFETGRRDGVLLVPNAALKWTPPATTADAGQTVAAKAGGTGRDRTTSGVVHVADANGSARPIPVAVGLSNGILAEVSGDGLSAGMDVVTGSETVVAGGAPSAVSPGGAPAAQESSPFLPKMPKPPSGGGGPPPGM